MLECNTKALLGSALRIPFSKKPSIPREKRPTIQWEGGQLPKHVDQAEQALINSAVEIYQRGSILVRPIINGPTTVSGIKYQKGSVHLHPVDPPWLVEQMTSSAKWVKRGKNGQEAINAPPVVASTYMARVGEWKVPHLVAIVESPTLRPDGSILDAPGYDAESGLLFKPSGNFSAIPQNPTQADALRALEVLKDLLKDFPFTEPHDLSVALSTILTALVRPSLRSAPMHAFRAPKMASGKSILVDVTAMIVTGRRAAVITPTQDANEERKRVFALLMNGDALASVDNIEQAWSSDVMCSVLTQETFQDRLLGHSKTLIVPCNTFWMCTGNNLTFKGDLTTRVLPCDLDPKTERPEQRSFDRDLYEYVPAHRDEIVRAALTILRAHHLAGRPSMGLKPYGRFEGWSSWIRSSLVWLGMADPCLSIADLEDSDPIRRHLRNLLRSWYGLFGDRPTTLADAVAQVKTGFGEEAEMLKDAFEAVAGERGNVNQRILGHFMSKYTLRIEGGFRIEKGGERKNATLWRIVPDANSLLNPPEQATDSIDKSTNPMSLVSSPQTQTQEENSSNDLGAQQTLQTTQPIHKPSQGQGYRVVSLFDDGLSNKSVSL